MPGFETPAQKTGGISASLKSQKKKTGGSKTSIQGVRKNGKNKALLASQEKGVTKKVSRDL